MLNGKNSSSSSYKKNYSNFFLHLQGEPPIFTHISIFLTDKFLNGRSTILKSTILTSIPKEIKLCRKLFFDTEELHLEGEKYPSMIISLSVHSWKLSRATLLTRWLRVKVPVLLRKKKKKNDSREQLSRVFLSEVYQLTIRWSWKTQRTRSATFPRERKKAGSAIRLAALGA